jgi:hypothetical protein
VRIKSLFAALLLLASPALADATSYGERTQETIPVDATHFLIFVGAPDEKQTGYTVDMIQIENGIPFYVPLFMEEFDAETAKVTLGYGVAFLASSYHYDKATGQLDIRTLDPQKHQRIDLHYKLDTDIFHLQQATSQSDAACTGNACKTIPKVLYKTSAKRKP